MRENREAYQTPDGEGQSQEKAFGCLFCMTGKESIVAKQI